MTPRNILALLTITSLVACSGSPKKPDAPLYVAPKPADAKATEPVVKKTADDSVPAPAPVADESETKPYSVKLEPTAVAAHKKEKGVDAKQSLLWLEHGNKRFVKGGLRKDGQRRKDIARLATAQHPHAIILSCSDSRVPPELVFDQKLGEIFVIRTAGEALDPNVIASIEYALVSFGSKLIVVMGHTSCGAIKAAIQTATDGDAGSPSLSHLVANIQPRIRASLAKGAPTDDAARESWANAQGIAEDLKRLSPIIRDAVENDGVIIQPALYYLNSGEVKFE